MKAVSLLGVFLVAMAIASYALTPQFADAESKVGAGAYCGEPCSVTTQIRCNTFNKSCNNAPRLRCLQGSQGVCQPVDSYPCSGAAPCYGLQERACVS